MADNCDHNIDHLTQMVEEYKDRLKQCADIDLDLFIRPLKEEGTPENTTHSWICFDGSPHGAGFKSKDLESWYKVKALCKNNMAQVSWIEDIHDGWKNEYGKMLSKYSRESGAWRELGSKDGRSLHITLYRNRIETKLCDISLHLDRISPVTGVDWFGRANYDLRRAYRHYKVELKHEPE